MSETLLAVLLVISSGKGSSLVYRWPPVPHTIPRLARPRLSGQPQPDNPLSTEQVSGAPFPLDGYEWNRVIKHTSTSPEASGASHKPLASEQESYDNFLGYNSKFLASMLSPQRSMCHQRFELIVDDLAFIGHPVCAGKNGVWAFKADKGKANPRGRGSRNRQDLTQVKESSPEKEANGETNGYPAKNNSWLQSFHFVLVLDRPDPSSSASGNVAKYFDIIYEQIAFTMTAVLYQEQVLSNFVEKECDKLSVLKEQCVNNGTPFLEFMTQAFEASSLPSALKVLYESIKSPCIAYLTINSLPLEIQLPPYLDFLLHPGDEEAQRFEDDPEETGMWGREMDVGWRLPTLAPWKSLLLLEGPGGTEAGAGTIGLNPEAYIKGPHVTPDDQKLAEGLIKFLETANITLSLADIASVLDWDLEMQVFPTVRWLVHHRRAKVVDVVHEGLKTVFSLSPKFDQPLSVLTSDFKLAFPDPNIPPLPRLLSALSMSLSSNASTSTTNQPSNTFFASVVYTRELIPAFTEVVVWLLKRGMLVTLHLRVRIAVDMELVKRVRERVIREKENKRTKLTRRKRHTGGNRKTTWLTLSPKTARKHSRSSRSSDSNGSTVLSDLSSGDDDFQNGQRGEYDEQNENGDEDHQSDLDPDLWEDYGGEQFILISDPARASPLQRKWLAAMSEGKPPHIARRFEQINQYFDGKKTDDEILYRAEIRRKQLREVLHHYAPYLQTFLHPS